MAAPKRLGRGLGSIIAGAAGGTPKKEAEPAVPKKSKKELSVAPPPVRAKNKHATKKTASSDQAVELAEGYMDVPVALVDPSPHQMRREFDEASITELAESIRSEGLIQPITVRRVHKRFELIAGERRLRACQKIGMKNITAHVIKAADGSAAVMGMIENLQREDLSPIDEALGYASLMDDFNLTQEEIAERLGKGRANVANHLRLLRLNKECQGYVSKGMLSFGHARAILALEGQDQQTLLARRVIESGMSVRDAEKLASQWKNGSSSTKKRGVKVPEGELAVVRDLEQRIASHLNTKVALKHTPKKGALTIEYYGNDDLQRILEKLGIEA